MVCEIVARKILIFDWDDTICPSSFVDKWKIENFRELPLHFQRLFSELAKCAEKCLEEASKYGEVIIITNSDDGWVKYSAERFVPNLVPILHKYRIISARTEYEQFYPNQPLCWKAAAFAHEVNEFYQANETGMVTPTPSIRSEVAPVSDESDVSFDENSELAEVCSIESLEGERHDACNKNFLQYQRRFVPLNTEVGQRAPYLRRELQREIISFGDSMEERTAVQIVSNQLFAIPKSVMFISCPNPIQIIGQLQMVTTYMKFICERERILDLEIDHGQADRFSNRYMKCNQCEYLSNIVESAEKQMTASGSNFSLAAATLNNINDTITASTFC